MSISGMLSICTQCTPPLVGPTLVRLGNARRNAIRRPPRHHTVVQNNGTVDSRTVQPNISPLRSANNVATTHIE
jgi:hypothetical protein